MYEEQNRLSIQIHGDKIVWISRCGTHCLLNAALHYLTCVLLSYAVRLHVCVCVYRYRTHVDIQWMRLWFIHSYTHKQTRTHDGVALWAILCLVKKKKTCQWVNMVYYICLIYTIYLPTHSLHTFDYTNTHRTDRQ